MNDERLRLFVALELPPEARQALADWRREAVGGVAGLRPVRSDQLHVTLCFMGWRSAREIDPIWAACQVVRSARQPWLHLEKAVWLPRRRPRVLAVELADADGLLARAQALVSGALEPGGWYTPEKRPFLAHVTLARVQKEARVSAREFQPMPDVGFHGSRVVLYRSRLERGGARYEALGSVELGSEPAAAPAEAPAAD